LRFLFLSTDITRVRAAQLLSTYSHATFYLIFCLLPKKVKIRIYENVILPLVLYGCETLSLTLREEPRLRVFENRVLRRIFGPKMDEVTGGWRKLHNEELHNLYSSPSIIKMTKPRRIQMGRACSTCAREEECM
jgi:hypothetical protein